MLFNRLFAKPDSVTAGCRAAVFGAAIGFATLAGFGTVSYADNPTGNTTGNVDVGGTVPSCCTWTGGTGNVSLIIPNFVDSSARVTVNNTASKALGTVTCSGPAYVRVRTTTGGLKNSAAPGAACDAAGNATCVNYKAVATWSAAGTPVATLPDTTGMPGTTALSPTTSSAASTGLVSIDVTPLAPAGNPPLNAGTFNDVAVVQVGNPI
jgi:hypothetical protein